MARCVYAVLARPDSEPHKPLAQQLFDLAQERSSPAGRFLKVYGAIRSEKEAQRVERKRIRKMEAVLDPALAAQRRIKATKAKRCAFRMVEELVGWLFQANRQTFMHVVCLSRAAQGSKEAQDG